MYRQQVRDVVHAIYSKCVRGRFVRVLSSTQESTLDDVQHGRVRKIQKIFTPTDFCQYSQSTFSSPNHSLMQRRKQARKLQDAQVEGSQVESSQADKLTS